MLSPAQVVFDFFVSQPEGTAFTRQEIKVRLSAFPSSHINGAILNLYRSGKLSRAPGAGIYKLVEGSRRPVSDAALINYHDTSSRGFRGLEARHDSPLFERAT